MTNYRLTDAAREDLENIYRYGLRTFGVQQADRYYFGLVNCLARIAENPLLYPAVDHIKPGYRRCTYISERIYFRIENDTVIISAIIGRQDAFKRL
jgi:toxin ParE1/3/4